MGGAERIKLHDTLVTARSSSAETVEGAALSLESVDDVESGDGLSLGVLSVHDGVADHVLKEALEDSASLLVDVRADSLDATTAGKSADSRLGNAEDGLTESLSVFVALSAGLAAALAFSASAELCLRCHCSLTFDYSDRLLNPCGKLTEWLISIPIG